MVETRGGFDVQPGGVPTDGGPALLKARGASLTGDILIFLVLTVLLSIIFYGLALVSTGATSGSRLYITGLMWSPGVAALLTTWLCGLDFRSFGWGWGDSRWARFAYLLPLGYSGLAYLVVWLAGWGAFADTDTVAKLAAMLGWAGASRWTVIIGYLLLTGTIGIVSGTASALGEEIGWRGFLVPRMVVRTGFTPAALIVGAIWTLWHVPLIIFGSYNQGAPLSITIPCFAVLVMSVSMIATWLRLRSGSVWPCALLHASHNLFIQAVFTPLTRSKGVQTLYTIGEFGLCVPAVTLVLAIYFWTRRDEALAAWNAR
jgi:membrane protease YdiL (CAAX protease family)